MRWGAIVALSAALVVPAPSGAQEPPPGSAEIWHAEPLMVSGADAYASGEYLYQDFVYDSFGANTTDVPFAAPDTVPRTADTNVGAMTGDVVYPTDEARYVYNAADILEFRARLVPGGVAYRVTLNAMADPQAAAVAIGIDTGPGGTDEWGFGIGALGPLGLEHVVVVSGEGAWLDGAWLPQEASSVDAGTNELEVRVPLDPGGATWRHYAGAGIWDAAADGFASVLDEPTATSPGGAHGTDAVPFLNIAFRFDEPTGTGPECLGSRGALSFGCGHWREHGQALALGARDISRFGGAIDFGKLAAAVDESHIPESGFMTRLHESRLDLGEGMQVTRPMLRGRVQPYGVYIPPSLGEGPAPLHLQLHWLYGTWAEFAILAPGIYEELGEDRDAIVITPAARGTDGWYQDEAEVDVFEAWADLASRYEIDADRVTISGYSMGGYGTFRLASGYPDLFAAAFGIAPPIDESIAGGATAGALRGVEALDEVDRAAGLQSWAHLTDDEIVLPVLENLRHTPLLMWAGTNDANVPFSGVVAAEQRLHELGYEHRLDLFAGFDHFAFHSQDRWGPARAWLDENPIRVDAPGRVTYRAVPGFDRPDLRLAHDGAWWIDGIEVMEGAESGLVDAISEGRGFVDPACRDAGGLGLDPSLHVSRGIDCEVEAQGPAANALVLVLEDVTTLAVDVDEAALVASEPLELTTTSNLPAVVRLRGAFGSLDVQVPAGTRTTVIVPDDD